jgi:hypothetical protein
MGIADGRGVHEAQQSFELPRLDAGGIASVLCADVYRGGLRQPSAAKDVVELGSIVGVEEHGMMRKCEPPGSRK